MDENSSSPTASSRILIRTTLRDLETHHSSIDAASNLLIQQLCKSESVTPHYLITRIADRGRRKAKKKQSREENQSRSEEKPAKHKSKKRGSAVDIVFDCNVKDNSSQFNVLAYRYSSRVAVKFEKLHHPQVGKSVNGWIEAYTEINRCHNLQFPRITDMRAETRRRRTHMPISTPLLASET
jgi:hypothetical protein